MNKFLWVFVGVAILVGSFLFINSTTACIICSADEPSFYLSSSLPFFSAISSREFYSFMNEEDDVVLLDIRTPEEFFSGRIDGALNIDFYSSSFLDEVNALDKNRVYLIYCRTGSRTSQAVKFMESLGFREVYYLDGGINSWVGDGFFVI